MTRATIRAMLLVALLAVPEAWAQSADDAVFQQAQAAYNRGDYAAAKAGWEPLAASGQGRAMEKLAWSYLYAPAAWGNDKAKSREWYERCVKTDETQCLFGWGWELASGRNYPKELDTGLALYRRAAAKGHGMAMTNLGWHYATGTGVAKDTKRAVEWYRKGAEVGNALAMSNLAAMYLDGTAGAKDYRLGREWAQKSADAGDRNGMNWMGVIHHNGWGVPVDLAKARAWYEKSAALGNDVAKNNLALLPSPTPVPVPAASKPAPAVAAVAPTASAQSRHCPADKAKQEAMKKRMIADAEAEIPYLMVNLGHAYFMGEYCFSRDLKQARFWFERAAAKGDVDAKEGLRHVAAAERQSQQSGGVSARARAQQDFIALIESVGPDRSDPHKFSYEVALYCQFGGKQCNVLRGMSEKFYDASNTRALQENMQRIRNQYRTTPAESQKFDARTKCLQQRSESIRRATYGQQDWYYDTKC